MSKTTEHDQFIFHITLTTGHARKSYKHEIRPDVLTVMHDLIRKIGDEPVALATTGAAIDPQVTITGTKSPHCLLTRIYAAGELVVTFGVASEARCGAAIWRQLHSDPKIPVVTDPNDRPPAPWAAARLEPVRVFGGSLLYVLGDFERCLAWGWLTRGRS